VVSDNDGSAFITKAEFDSLKNNFQSQIDQYNTNIDSKIDNAIASYLSGIKVTLTETKDVLYFKTLSSGTTEVAMKPYSSFAFSYGNPKIKAGFIFSSIYTALYAVVANADFSYDGDANGKRRFVKKIKVGTSDKYMWDGYGINYQENFSITWGFNGQRADTGFDLAENATRLYPFGLSIFNETTSTKDATWTDIKGRIGDGNTTHGIFTPQNCTVETKWNNYDVNNKHDLIYSDYTATSPAASDFKAFQQNNPDNRWFAGSDKTYLGVISAGTITGSYVMQVPDASSGTDEEGRIKAFKQQEGSIGSYWNNNNSNAYKNIRFFSCGFEPDVKKWANVLANDENKYTDLKKSGSDKTFQYYSMIDGMPFVEAEKDKTYEWPVEFTSATTGNVWLKYGVYNGAPSDSSCISVTVDGGEEAKHATLTNGKGTIKFKAPEDGLIFAKWTQNISLNVGKSGEIKVTDNRN
jgi:hypothetical protein